MNQSINHCSTHVCAVSVLLRRYPSRELIPTYVNRDGGQAIVELLLPDTLWSQWSGFAYVSLEGNLSVACQGLEHASRPTRRTFEGLRHLWKSDSLGDIRIFVGSTNKNRAEMSHLVLFHRPECSFKTDKIGSVKFHLVKHHRNHHRNHVVYAYAHMYGLHLGYLITSNGMLLNLQRPDYSWKEHKMIKK